MTYADPYESLCHAVVKQAVSDYRTAIDRYWSSTSHIEQDAQQGEMARIRKFFESTWFLDLTGAAGKPLFPRMVAQVKGEVIEARVLRFAHLLNKHAKNIKKDVAENKCSDRESLKEMVDTLIETAVGEIKQEARNLDRIIRRHADDTYYQSRYIQPLDTDDSPGGTPTDMEDSGRG